MPPHECRFHPNALPRAARRDGAPKPIAISCVSAISAARLTAYKTTREKENDHGLCRPACAHKDPRSQADVAILHRQFRRDHEGRNSWPRLSPRSARVAAQHHDTDRQPEPRAAYGIEHIAVQTDDYPGTLAKLKANGVHILEEMPPNNGRHVCFLEAPDGAQMELIEKV